MGRKNRMEEARTNATKIREAEHAVYMKSKTDLEETITSTKASLQLHSYKTTLSNIYQLPNSNFSRRNFGGSVLSCINADCCK